MAAVTGPAEAARLMAVPARREQSGEAAAAAAENGILIGASGAYSMPFFLDTSALMNPHIFITGMTGSGKTYLTRSLMIKLHALLDCTLVVIDLTGEYRATARLFGAREAAPRELSSLLGSGERQLVYVGLAGLGEAGKSRGAATALAHLARRMRRGAIGEKRRVFVILDEAWKLVGRKGALETMIREGRKYGLGVVAASQLLSDLDAAFLSNIATIFAFRVQDRDSLGVLQRDYGLGDGEIAGVQNLQLGSCLVIQVRKHGERSAFFIRRVIGAEAETAARISIGEDVHVEIGIGAIEEMARGAIGRERAGAMAARLRERGEVRLECLIRELLDSGGEAIAILRELRRLGIDEDDLGDAFALAVCPSAGEGEGRRQVTTGSRGERGVDGER